MKIVQLVYTLGSGGAEKFVVNLSNQLADLGHEVYVVQLRCDQVGTCDIYFNKPLLGSKIHYINLGLTKGFRLKKALQVMRFLVKLSPDIVHSHNNLLPYYYPLTISQSKIKFVHTLHSVADKETGSKWQRRINRWFYKYRHITPVTISDECRESFVTTYGISEVACINNGCPGVTKTENFEAVRDELNSYKASKSTKTLLHVARFGEAKNQTLLVSAFNKLVKEGHDINLIVLGDGFNTEKASTLRELSCDRIHYLGSKSNVSDYLLNSDYFVMSSLWEGLPISLIEAMSAKLVPISTPAGGIVNVIHDGYNGFLSPDFSEDNYVNTIKRALNTPIDPDRVFEWYDMEFSMVHCTREYERIYSNLIS